MRGTVHALTAPCCSNCQQQQARGPWACAVVAAFNTLLLCGLHRQLPCWQGLH